MDAWGQLVEALDQGIDTLFRQGAYHTGEGRKGVRAAIRLRALRHVAGDHHGAQRAVRPDDGPVGVPATGDFTDDVRSLYTPLAAERPHRVATPLFARYTGVPRSSCGAQGIIDRTAEDLRPWHAESAPREAEAVGEVGAAEATAVLALSGCR